MDSLEQILLKKGSCATVFNLKEKILGSKQKPQEAIAIVNPDTNEMLTDRKEIMKTTLKYCRDLLIKKSPSDEYEEDFKSKRDLHNKRLNEKDDDEYEEDLTWEMFNKALIEISKKKSNKYKFILKSGQSYKNALF